MKKYIITSFIIILSSLLFTACKSYPEYYVATLPIDSKPTTAEEVYNMVGFDLPLPEYLPDAYEYRNIYVFNNIVRLIYSDKEIQVVQQAKTDIEDTKALLEYRCKMQIDVVWSSQGIPGGLKLPGERPSINPQQGLTIASVIVDTEDHFELWWDWRPDPNEKGMFQIVISTTKSSEKSEMVKVAESIVL